MGKTFLPTSIESRLAGDRPGVLCQMHKIEGDTVSFSITDGGPGDHDLTANGVIVDPGAPGIAVAPVPIPAMSRWAVMVLRLLLMVMGRHCATLHSGTDR